MCCKKTQPGSLDAVGASAPPEENVTSSASFEKIIEPMHLHDTMYDALKVGLSPRQIEQAIKIQIGETGRPFATSEELIGAALKFEDEVATSAHFPALESVPRHRLELEAPQASAKLRDPELGDEEAYLNSDAVLNALEVGLSAYQIREAVKEKFEETGKGFATTEELIEVALDVRDEKQQTPEEVAQVPEQDSDVLNLLREVLDNNETEKGRGGNVVVQQPSEKLCKVCFDQDIGVVFEPCGHLASCGGCAALLRECPICRAVIIRTFKTYFSWNWSCGRPTHMRAVFTTQSRWL